MKTLTLHQPWASLVALGVKTIETRSWSTSYRGPLAIHAGLRKPGFDDMRTVVASHEAWNRWVAAGHIERASCHVLPGPLGAVVATATLVDCVPIRGDRINDGHVLVLDDELWLAEPAELQAHEPWATETVQSAWRIDEERPFGDYRDGRWAWILTDILPLAEPIPARGHQGLWTWDEAS